MKQAKHAGLAYPKAPTIIDQELEKAFNHEMGPGALPSKGSKKLSGILVPHGSLEEAGPCMAWGYKELAEAEKGVHDFYFVIAPNSSSEESGLLMNTIQFPHAEVRSHQSFVRALCEKGNIAVNDDLFDQEASWELQVPWLQFIHKNSLEKVKVVVLLLGEKVPNLKDLAIDVKETILETGVKPRFVIVNNFTAFGPDYKHVPFSADVAKNIYERDEASFELIKSQDSDGFLKYVDEEICNYSNPYGVALALEAMNFSKAEVENYYTTGDLKNSYKNSVSYAAIIFR